MKKSIYIIRNTVNDKVYVGQAADPHRRFISHLSKAKTNLDHSAIHNAINALGKDKFYYEILEKDVENYNEREQYWIKYFDCIVPNGYNLTKGGEDPPFWYGEEHPRSIISNQEVDSIINDLRYSNLTQAEIAKKYHQNTQLITSINNGLTHKKEDLEYPIRTGSPYHLSQQEVEEIQWLLLNTQFKISEIAKYYNVHTSAIKNINAGRNHKNPDLTYPLKTGRATGENESVSTILAKRSTATIDT